VVETNARALIEVLRGIPRNRHVPRRVSFERLQRGEFELRAERVGYRRRGTLTVPGSERFVVLLERTEETFEGEPSTIVGVVRDERGQPVAAADIRQDSAPSPQQKRAVRRS
jgi:hypothetical protein